MPVNEGSQLQDCEIGLKWKQPMATNRNSLQSCIWLRLERLPECGYAQVRILAHWQSLAVQPSARGNSSFPCPSNTQMADGRISERLQGECCLRIGDLVGSSSWKHTFSSLGFWRVSPAEKQTDHYDGSLVWANAFLRDATKCLVSLERGCCILVMGCFLEASDVTFWKGQFL